MPKEIPWEYFRIAVIGKSSRRPIELLGNGKQLLDEIIDTVF